MFRALLCPSSGALDYMCVIAAYSVQCLVAGCRGSGAGSRPCVQEEGCCTSCNIPRRATWGVAWPLKMRQIGCPETSEWSHHTMLR